MTLKLSSTQILSCLVGLSMFLLLGTLVYSLNLMNRQYHNYKLQAIMNSPYESYGKITGKYPMGGGFEITYQFKGVVHEQVMRVGRKQFREYKTGDKIPITLSSKDPSLVSLTSQLNNFKTKN